MFNWFRNIAMVVILVAIIILSFWISFLIGKRIIVPVKKIPTQYLLTEEAGPLFQPEITLEVESVTVEEKPILRPITPQKQVVAEKAKPVRAVTGIYTIQLGAFSNRQNAEGLANQLNKRGFSASVKSVGGFYKVFSGSFQNAADARAYLKKLSAAGFEGVLRRSN